MNGRVEADQPVFSSNYRRSQVRQAELRDGLRRHQPEGAERIAGTLAHSQSRALDRRSDASHPRLELRRRSKPYPHRPRAREHDPAAPLRHRPHQRSRARRRRDRAELGQKTAAGHRLPEKDRQRRAAASARLTGLYGARPSPWPTLDASGANGDAQMKPCSTRAASGTAIQRHHDPVPPVSNENQNEIAVGWIPGQMLKERIRLAPAALSD